MSVNGKRAQVQQEVEISVGDKVRIKGDLCLLEGAKGIVLFSHGSGSSRFSPRNRYVAGVIQQGGLSTLLIDLLTEREEVVDLDTRQLRFDIELLAARVIGVTRWLLENDQTQDLAIGYFGASTGAAAALAAAAELGDVICAVVSRGGRPDLAGAALSAVQAPTLLIVGGNDFVVIDLNRQASEQLTVEKKVAIVLGATHLFQEPGALEQVAQEATSWFVRYLCCDKKN